MNVLLWVFQVLLALHTVMGALWKFSNSTQVVPSLSAIPHGVWTAMSLVEIVCAIGLILPVVNKQFGMAAPIAAAVIAIEMLFICGVHFSSGTPFNGQVVYWLVVAAFSSFIAYGRFALKPF